MRERGTLLIFPIDGSPVDARARLALPAGWRVALRDDGRVDDPAAYSVPEGRFVGAAEVLPDDRHMLATGGHAYRLSSPRPYQVTLTQPIALPAGDYVLELLLHADWHFRRGRVRVPPHANDHARVRCEFGAAAGTWVYPHPMQQNVIRHHVTLAAPATIDCGFTIEASAPATRNDCYIQRFRVVERAAFEQEPGGRHRVVVNLLPQDASLHEKWHVLYHTHVDRQTLTQSHDDAIALVGFGRDDSLIRIWGSNRLNADQQQAIAATGFAVQHESLDGPLQPLPDDDHETAVRVVVNLLPQDATLLEKWHVLQTVHVVRQTLMQSHDDAINLVKLGRSDSYVRLWARARFNADQLQALGDNQIQVQDEAFPSPPPVAPFRFTHWPTQQAYITQAFGANAAYYSQFGLPGHEGVDIAAWLGSDLYAVADGTVSAINLPAGSHNYGIFVRIDHAHGYQTTYAHMQEVSVSVGQRVSGGQLIGRGDSTGNVRPRPTPENPGAGSHLHLTLKRFDAGPTIYPYNIVDPTPFLRQLPEYPTTGEPSDVQDGPLFDLLPYMQGDGRLYEVRDPAGGQERLQGQRDGGRFYIVKHANWEELWADDSAIWRGFDTSPGGGRYYIQYEPGYGGARWVNRFMRVGETFYGNVHWVQFFHKGNCAPSDLNSGPANNETTLFAHHAQITWHGMTIDDVLEMGKDGGERFWFARGYGLVAWQSAWGQSAISEIHAPGARPNNVREQIPCLQRPNRGAEAE